MSRRAKPAFYEFFCGGGMARAGLGPGWECIFANDVDARKAASYAANWGSRRLRVEDIGVITADDLPGRADLAWASFPCQDLSLAGEGAGLNGKRSGTFWRFHELMRALEAEGRGPRVILLENVCGAITSHEGRDFEAIVSSFVSMGYSVGAFVLDARWFVPHSRPRLFFVAVPRDTDLSGLNQNRPGLLFHPASLERAVERLSPSVRRAWLWWKIPVPPERAMDLADIIEERPDGVRWHEPEYTQRLLTLMSPVNRAKVAEAAISGRRAVGCVYRRTRVDESGRRRQRAEVRFDGIAGCLRTPAGGSSRQTVLIVEGEAMRSRLLSPREAARLMGLPETYVLPRTENDACHLIGDGVAVPVVRHVARFLIEPLINLEPLISPQLQTSVRRTRASAVECV